MHICKLHTTGRILTHRLFRRRDSDIPNTNQPLHSYTLLETKTNETQDCIYNPTTQHFVPKTQEYRQAVLLQPHAIILRRNSAKHLCWFSIPSNKNWNRFSRIPQLPNRKVRPTLQRLGHKAEEVVKKLVEISYFPTKSEKPTQKYKHKTNKDSTNTHHKKGLQTNAKIPLAPLKARLKYGMPNPTIKHKWQSVKT